MVVRASTPLVSELNPPPDELAVLRAVAEWRDVVLLESALRREDVGRYSFLTAEPVEQWTLTAPQFGADPFAPVREWLRGHEASAVAGLPPFQGGVIGLASYELGGCWEQLPEPRWNDLPIPVLQVRAYDWVLAWDHAVDRAWIIAHGAGAAGRTAKVQAAVAERSSPRRLQISTGSRLLAPAMALPGHEGVLANFTRAEYLTLVERVIEYIRAGDIFQANLSQRLVTPLCEHPIELYVRLRRLNPAPFAAYFASDDWTVVSASPERFLRLQDRDVETRPIKGTRQRRLTPEADLFTRDELRESDKDRAENVMIVDLLRNDLSRVCEPCSVRVPRLCAVETYETVQHLVSVVRGRLEPGRDFWDLLQAAFPGGSITGAPKVRAMQIICELEQVARGPYCGSLFYVGWDGRADSSILIRTFTCRNGWGVFPVGGGIVAQSDPAAEYEETLTKAEGLLRAL
jgi:para-aminobenzoate synthetase component 1